jgi:LysR family transcriptional regulator, hypochlorite-specific transcription factor HypT
METKWLEDFVSLAETRSFSRSAQLRHVTQPAFSRRIQALESWAGTDLVDRSSYPTRLTPAGRALYDQALEQLQLLQSTRAMLRNYSSVGQDVIEFAVPHTLAFTFFPAWVAQLANNFGPIKSRLKALNVHDAVMQMVEGTCDILIAYHHAAQPLQLDVDRYEMVLLGRETLVPCCKPDASGAPLFALPGKQHSPLPYLAYGPGAYLGRIVDQWQKQHSSLLYLDRVYETDMAEGLKAMALEGLGVAFLPASAIARELATGKLVPSTFAPFATSEVAMEIRAYREMNTTRHAAKPVVQKLWDYLVQTSTGSASAHASTGASKGT